LIGSFARRRPVVTREPSLNEEDNDVVCADFSCRHREPGQARVSSDQTVGLPTVGSHLAARLYDQGHPRYLFGVPGGAINGFYKAVRDDGRITAVLNAHETGAVLAAYGYARATGSLGLCAVTSGPGATNAVTGMAAAWCDSVPVALLSAQAMVDGRNAVQDSSAFGVDTVSIMRPVTRLSAALTGPDQAGVVIERALRAARSGRPGPIHLSMNGMLPFAPFSGQVQVGQAAAMRAFDPEAVEQAAALIAAHERVAVIAGHGVEVSGAAVALRRLAEEHAIAVANTPKGRNFSERHPLSLGVYGMGGHSAAEEFIAKADVVILVGTGLGEFVNAFEPLTPRHGVVQIDLDPAAIGLNTDVEVGVLGDARAALSALSDALHRRPRRREATRLARKIAQLRTPEPDLDGDPDRGIHPGTLIRTLDTELPDDTIMVPDTGNSTGQVIHHWTAEPGCYVSAWGLASMACAIPVSTGVRLARPDQPVVAVVGDGALAMNPGELHTQAEYGIKVITIVVNDGGHGMVDHLDQAFFGENVSPSRFSRVVDAAAVAEGLGVRGLRVRTRKELRAALRTALRHRGPVLVDATVDPGPMAPVSPRFMPRTRSAPPGHGKGVE
jgi:acetolactate synthase I/II/III large subunit